jgi:hypothetical protein
VIKSFSFLLLILVAGLSSAGAATSLEDLSPHLSTNAAIVWDNKANGLPRSFWIYRRHGPTKFPASVISNAVLLASLQSKGFPKPSTKDFFIPEDRPPNYPGAVPVIFSIQPSQATIFYGMPHHDTGSGENIPDNATIVKRGWEEALRFGIEPRQLRFKNMTSHFCRRDENSAGETNFLCGRGAFLSRQLDGVVFLGSGDNGCSEGFWLELGSHGKVRAFSLNWPHLVRYNNHETASLVELTECIRARKVIVLPNLDETRYSERVKGLANTTKLTITKTTPFYGEGVFGETPGNGAPSEFVTPFAELEAVADLGSSNANVRILSPVLSSEVSRLLKGK